MYKLLHVIARVVSRELALSDACIYDYLQFDRAGALSILEYMLLVSMTCLVLRYSLMIEIHDFCRTCMSLAMTKG